MEGRPVGYLQRVSEELNPRLPRSNPTNRKEQGCSKGLQNQRPEPLSQAAQPNVKMFPKEIENISKCDVNVNVFSGIPGGTRCCLTSLATVISSSSLFPSPKRKRWPQRFFFAGHLLSPTLPPSLHHDNKKKKWLVHSLSHTGQNYWMLISEDHS